MSQAEYEVKILEIDFVSIRKRLCLLGALEIFNGHIAADFFRNSSGQKIRLRKMGGRNILTHKIAHPTIGVLGNEEIEIVFDNYEGMVQLLMASGFELYGHSEKLRVTYEYQNIHFDIDTMVGIPAFLEVEAHNVDDVKRGVELLGYTMDQTCMLTERTLKEYYGIA